MTVAIAVKGTEGIVLAVDSRVTIQLVTQQVTPQGTTNVVLPATYDNATKLLKPSNQNFVGAVTYGNAVFDPGQPRTAHSFLSEFEATLGDARISVREFAIKLGQFYLARWNAAQQTGEPANFIIGGYDENEPYGRLYSVETQVSRSQRNCMSTRSGPNGAVKSRWLMACWVSRQFPTNCYLCKIASMWQSWQCEQPLSSKNSSPIFAE
jgi:hypothetical protein